ncbi:MAG: ergothioneine biosynthesis protein EgtB [Acidimicrobiales bacterium]|nr:ergothioneine biosynthesis protein EgtB [Acidimicrobiales bacterium]
MTIDLADLADARASSLERARARTLAVVGPYDDAILRRQHDPLMSPLVWDVAHVANYEDLWLVRALGGPPTRTGLDDTYDAFKQPRRDRERLPLMTLAEARAYGEDVRARALDLLHRADLSSDGPEPLLRDGFVHEMVVQHEHQHVETLLAAVQLLPPGEGHRLDPAAAPAARSPAVTELGSGAAELGSGAVLVPGGPFEMGTDHPLAYDNERPCHVVQVGAFWMDVAPVTNGQYQAFVAAGGYDDRRWWGADGWAWRQEAGLVAPQFWQRDGDGWAALRFGHLEALDPHEPVQHVCWHEACAYARWAGKRLPTEAEWEKAARFHPGTSTSRTWPWGDAPADPTLANLAHPALGATGLRGPAAVGSYAAGASAVGCQQMVGDVWEWTSTPFGPHPGFAAFPYEEYSAVFHGSGYKVLRGGSWATHPSAARTTFRNWDLPIRRQIFAGFRCARDVDPRRIGS